MAVNEPNPAICDSCQPLADATVVPAPVMIVPTIYPSDPAAPIVVHNYITINVQAAGFREFAANLDVLVRLLRQSNEIAGETRDQLVAEITAGRTILTAPNQIEI